MKMKLLTSILALTLWSACSSDDSPTSATGVELQPLAADRLLNELAQTPSRTGDLPERTFGVPHLQLTQGGPVDLADRLVAAIDQLDSVSIGVTQLQRDGGMLYNDRSWNLQAGASAGPDRERFEGGSIGQTHHPNNNSMHVFLPRSVSRGMMQEGGWGEIHPFNAMNGLGTEHVDYVMLWGPRNERELQVVWLLVQTAYAQARDQLP